MFLIQEPIMRNLACVVVLLTAILSVGCTKTVIKRVARFDSDRDSISAVAPETGVYKVKYSFDASKDSRSVADSSRNFILQRSSAGKDTAGTYYGTATHAT